MPKKTAIIATHAETNTTVRFETMKDAERRGGFDYSCVIACVHGRKASYLGYTFRAELPTQYQPKGRVVQVASLYNAGRTIREIADHYGIKYRSAQVRVVHARQLGLIKKRLA